MSSNGYPFTTRRQIIERIDADEAFAAECVAILQDRYEHRADGGECMGWMASHAAKATELAAKIASGEATEKEIAEAARLAKHYGKQLARAFRERELAARPELGAQAAVFGVAQAPPASIVEGQSATRVAAAEPKRRGRPKGSKNKPKDSNSARRQRSRS